MKQELILQEKERYIYLFEEGDIKFYLTIPRAKEISLILNLKDAISASSPEKMPLVQNKAIITPIVEDALLLQIKENTVDAFHHLDEIFSKAINMSHKILTYNHLEVDASVYFIENDSYAMFWEWFVKKYNGRVKKFHLEEKKESDSLENSVISKEMFREVSTQNEPSNDNISKVTPEETMMEDKIPSPPISNAKGSFGFVSYVLLGVVAAVLSLVFLYFII